jgi:hypothetical protein
LTKRVESEHDAKEAMGHLFWQIMYGRIRRHRYFDIFFESGSTLAYVSEAFEHKARLTGSDNEKEWSITTNNALTLLQLLLHANMTTNPLPPAPPEDYYGAMFGRGMLHEPQTHPTIPRRLYASEKNAIAEAANLLKQGIQRRLFLATASGLDLRHPAVQFRGPHVGSHANMLFKRAIFETGQPVVLFFTEKKIDFAFEIGKCYPVFGPDRTWLSILAKYPLAICIGYHKKQRADVIKDLIEFGKHGFELEYAHKEVSGEERSGPAHLPRSTGGVVIMANRPFVKIFPRE